MRPCDPAIWHPGFLDGHVFSSARTANGQNAHVVLYRTCTHSLFFPRTRLKLRLDFEQLSIFIRLCVKLVTGACEFKRAQRECELTNTAEAKQTLVTSGLVLHRAALYDLTLWLLSRGRESAFREKVLRLARLSPGEQVLDVGCGTGTLAIAAKRQVGTTGTVYGVDASPEMLARANRKVRKAGVEIVLKNALVEALPFPDGRFDVVLSTVMLHHLPGKLRRQCAAEIRRVLKPGGRVLAVDFGTSPSQKRGFVAHFHRHGHISLARMATVLVPATSARTTTSCPFDHSALPDQRAGGILISAPSWSWRGR